MRTLLLYTLTAFAEILGCYLPYPVALLWLWGVDGIRPSRWDLIGAAVALLGMALIAFQPKA